MQNDPETTSEDYDKMQGELLKLQRQMANLMSEMSVIKDNVNTEIKKPSANSDPPQNSESEDGDKIDVCDSSTTETDAESVKENESTPIPDVLSQAATQNDQCIQESSEDASPTLARSKKKMPESKPTSKNVRKRATKASRR